MHSNKQKRYVLNINMHKHDIWYQWNKHALDTNFKIKMLLKKNVALDTNKSSWYRQKMLLIPMVKDNKFKQTCIKQTCIYQTPKYLSPFLSIHQQRGTNNKGLK